MPGKLVVGIQGDDAAHDALALGVELARTMKAELVLTATWTAPFGLGLSSYDRAVRALLHRELEAVASEVPPDVVATTQVSGATSTVRALHELAEEHRASVLVIGRSHLAAPLRAVRGDIALGVIHDAPCAVAVAPAGWRHTAGAPRDVIVGWDASDEARAALEHAVGLAAAVDGALRVVHVVQLPHEVTWLKWLDPPLVREWLDDVTAAAQEAMESARTQVAGRVPVRCEVIEGRPGTTLARFADGADLLVTGSRGYGSLRRVVLGSTTARVLHDATVPVLVLPRGVPRRSGQAEQVSRVRSAAP
jgi:nucleotide-binding universal stress UspA family protein